MHDEVVVWTEDFSGASRELIGGKCEGLGWLRKVGLPTPVGFCLTSRAFGWFAKANRLLPPEGVSDSESLLRSLPTAILDSELPTELSAIVTSRGKDLAAGSESMRLAVRSSFGTEDSHAAPSTGQYATVLDVTPEQLSQAVRQVWASAFSDSALKYRLSKRLALREVQLAILVQPYIRSVLGGIALTMDPQTRDIAITTVESVAGQPVALTSGVASCNRYLVSKTNLECIGSIEVAGGAARMQGALLQRLVLDCKALERQMNTSVVVEWCSPAQGELLYLQARIVPSAAQDQIELPWVSKIEYSSVRSPKIRAASLKRGQLEGHVITPSAFAAFARHRSIGSRLGQVLESLFHRYLAKGAVSIRPAYWSALQSGNMLPQSGRLTTTAECMRHLSTLWTYIIDAGLVDYTAQVACLVGNWLPVYASAIAATRGMNRETLVIHALYGSLEGLEKYAYDVYVMTLGTLEIVETHIANKEWAIKSRERGAERVLREEKAQSVLREDEIYAVAALCRSAMLYQQSQIRIEALIIEQRGPDAVVPWQWENSDAPIDVGPAYLLVPADGEHRKAVHRGSAVIIKSGTAIPDISELVSPILIVDMQSGPMRSREWVINLGIAAQQSGAVVVFEGSILSHFAATLREFGVAVYPVQGPLGTYCAGELLMIARA